MIDKQNFQNTPMGKALIELSERMSNENMPPVSLNVVGGFALMMRELRNPNDTTDIDYVGETLPKDFNRIANEIGMKHNLGKGWINNDVMLADISMEDFEFATGKLHFEPTFSVGNISINVLEEPDLLRMKLIAIDTSLSAIDNGGEFTRMKDLPDVIALMERTGITHDDLDTHYSKWITSETTGQVIKTYAEKGNDEVIKEINKRTSAYQTKVAKNTASREGYKPSAYITNLMNSLYQRAAQEDSDEDDTEYC